MRSNRWTKWMGVTVMGAGMAVLGATTVRADDSQVLAGPKADAPTTQPNNGGHRFAGDRGDMMRERMHKLMDGVNPTDDQKAKIKTVFDDMKTKNDAWRTQNQAQLQTLHEQMKAAHDAKDQAKMKDLRGQMDSIMASQPVKLKDAIGQVRGVLTPEQQATFDANLAKMKQDHPKRANGMMDGNGPAKGGDKNAAPATDKNKLDI